MYLNAKIDIFSITCTDLKEINFTRMEPTTSPMSPLSSLHDDVGCGGDVGFGETAVSVCIGIFQVERCRGMPVLGIDEFHDVGSVHYAVIVCIS